MAFSLELGNTLYDALALRTIPPLFLLSCTPFSVANKVLVTGYGGFLGKAICHQLLKAGFQVRGLARNHYSDMNQLGVEGIQGSATDRTACETACKGVVAIVHTAALAGVWGPRRTYEETNVRGTEYLLAGAQKEGIQTFVYTSSPSVTFDGSPQINMDESAPYPKKWLCDYPRTKAIAEQKVLEANGSRFRTCALRPHLIWGRGDPHLIPRVIARRREGKLMRVGTGRNLIDTVHVEAAARAHLQSLERLLDSDQNAAGRPYFLTDGSPLECWDWISTILTSARLTPPTKSISLPMAYRLGGILEFIYKALRKVDEPPMTRFVAKQLGVDHYFNIDQAKRLLGYQPIEDRDALVRELSCEQ